MFCATKDHPKFRNALTVVDLIKQLLDYPMDAIPLFQCDGGAPGFISCSDQVFPIEIVDQIGPTLAVADEPNSKSGLAVREPEGEIPAECKKFVILW